MFMLSHALTVSISHSFLLILRYFYCSLFHSAMKLTDFSRYTLICINQHKSTEMSTYNAEESSC